MGRPAGAIGSIADAVAALGTTTVRESGFGAVSDVRSGRYDCLVCEATLPDMDGVQFVEWAQRIDGSVSTILVVETDDFEDLFRAQTAGVDGVLSAAATDDQVVDVLTRATTAGRIEAGLTRGETLSEAVTSSIATVLAADTRTEVERAICDALSGTGEFPTVWVSRLGGESSRLDPSVAAGIDPEALASVALPEGLSAATDPVIVEDPPAADVLVVLRTGETVFGAVHLTGERASGETERTALTALARTAARRLADLTGETRRPDATDEGADPLEQYGAVVGHELDNQLQVAYSALKTLREHDETGETAVLEMVFERIQRITDEALAVARTRVDPDAIETRDLRTTVETAWDRIDSADTDLFVGESAPVVADHDLLELVFENLFRNAVEHGGESVNVRVGALPDRHRIYVEDTGGGVPPEERERLFEWGYAGNGNSGFGLAIVAALVEAHGWEIELVAPQSDRTRFEISGVTFG